MKSRLPEHLNLLPGPQIPVLVQGLLPQDGPSGTEVHQGELHLGVSEHGV